MSGGGGGGASAAAGGAGAPPSLSALGVVKAATSGLLGDVRLASLPTEIGHRAYCHNAHGAVLAPDPLVPSLYIERGKPAELRRLQVPPNCAYVTVAEEGYETESTSIELAIFYEVWGKAENIPLFQDIILGNKHGEEARSLVMEILDPVSPKEGYTPAIIVNPGIYAPIVIKPFCVWYYPPEVSGGLPIYSFARSGIFPCGTPGCEVIKDFNNCRATTASDELLSWMYDGSVFPTVDQLLGDETLRKIRNDYYPDDYIRFYNMHNYITNQWACSQELLFIKFPGAHYNFVCRLDATERDRVVLKAVPQGSRLLSLKGSMGLAEKITAFAVAGKFPRMRSGNSRRNRNRHRTQSKRRTRKHRK